MPPDLASLFLRSLAFGLAVAAPVGPMALLCMRRTLDSGWHAGMATGAGIATADGIYAALAAFGIAGLSGLLLAHARLFHLGAGLVLLWLGLSTLRTLLRPARTAAAAPLHSHYLGAAALTLANPPTILTFAALFAALAPPGGFPPTAALVTTGGVFAGSALWWLGLVSTLAALGHALGARLRAAITLVAGLALALFGLVTLAAAF